MSENLTARWSLKDIEKIVYRVFGSAVNTGYDLHGVPEDYAINILQSELAPMRLFEDLIAPFLNEFYTEAFKSFSKLSEEDKAVLTTLPEAKSGWLEWISPELPVEGKVENLLYNYSLGALKNRDQTGMRYNHNALNSYERKKFDLLVDELRKQVVPAHSVMISGFLPAAKNRPQKKAANTKAYAMFLDAPVTIFINMVAYHCVLEGYLGPFMLQGFENTLRFHLKMMKEYSELTEKGNQ